MEESEKPPHVELIVLAVVYKDRYTTQGPVKESSTQTLVLVVVASS